MKLILKIISVLIISFIIFTIIFYYTFLKYLNIHDFSTIGTKPIYNKRIAICISGQFRKYREIFKNHIDSILGINGDIFICADDNLSNVEKEEIENFYKPKICKWDGEKVEKIKNYPVNLIYMLKRIYLCDKLRQKYEEENKFKYDVVVRLRPDLILKSYIPENVINNLKSESLYIPVMYKNDIWWSRVFGPTDMFILGDGKSMKVFSECFLHLQDLESDTCMGENLTYGYYENRVENIYKFPCHFVLYTMILNPTWESMKNFFISKYIEKSYFLKYKNIQKCKENNNLSSKRNIRWID